MKRKQILWVGAILLVATGLVAGVVILAVLAAAQDRTAPSISDVTVTDVSPTSAVITWTTDEPAGSSVNCSYERGGIGLVVGEVNLPALVMSHSVSLVPLQPDTTYTYRVASADESGNEAVSGEYTFTTLPLP